MGKHRPLSILALVMVLLAGIGGGMLIQAKVQQAGADAALVRTTAERDRLLEHLADVESGVAGADCIPIMVWACPVKGGAQ